MRSRWFRYKPVAIRLRTEGLSIRSIESRLGIPKSTLSGWFRAVPLSDRNKKALFDQWMAGLAKAREKASHWHRTEKKKRTMAYRQESEKVLDSLHFNDSAMLELAAAMLYLGEGTKKSSALRMSNSSPLILKTFMTILQRIYYIENNKIKCGLNLRADQSPQALKRFWSKKLDIPLRNFTYVIVDKRTSATRTYPDYKGVCMIRVGRVANKERLMNVANGFCERITK